MEIEFNYKCIMNLNDPKIKTIMKTFVEILPKLLNEFVEEITLMFAEEYMRHKEKPFECKNCGNKVEFIWKRRQGEETKILTIFQKITLKQLQVQ